MAQQIEHPYYPIIYVRGFAGTMGEVEATAATPYMGFNLGSMKVRQLWDKSLEKHVFESPLIRLMKDVGYKDVYDGGGPLVDHITPIGVPDRGDGIDPRSIVIFRYYDEASESFGGGKNIPIKHYAGMLHTLINNLAFQVTGGDPAAMKKFRVYLVAHSMGGLICRCFLQNPQVGTPATKALVDKVFTYATPHNGIDVRILGNVPTLWFKDSVDTFNRGKLRDDILALADNKADRVDTLDGHFPPDRFFCLVGTNSKDYNLAKLAVGPISDGLVRIENATVRNAPRAFTHRSHSGDYGIVNSESGYQNLIRFLFGDIRVDGTLVVKELTLPPEVQRELDAGHDLKASYHFECVVRTRGARWDLHRRLTDEHSAIHRTYDELFKQNPQRSPRLFSQFLSKKKWALAKKGGQSLGFQVEIRVQVPEYTIDRNRRRDGHYDGSYIYNERLIFEVTPSTDKTDPVIKYGFESRTPGRATRKVNLNEIVKAGDGSYTIPIPVRRNTAPGIDATLMIKVQPWNRGGPR